jgi:hypothetical protein
MKLLLSALIIPKNSEVRSQESEYLVIFPNKITEKFWDQLVDLTIDKDDIQLGEYAKDF